MSDTTNTTAQPQNTATAQRPALTRAQILEKSMGIPMDGIDSVSASLKALSHQDQTLTLMENQMKHLKMLEKPFRTTSGITDALAISARTAAREHSLAAGLVNVYGIGPFNKIAELSAATDGMLSAAKRFGAKNSILTAFDTKLDSFAKWEKTLGVAAGQNSLMATTMQIAKEQKRLQPQLELVSNVSTLIKASKVGGLTDSPFLSSKNLATQPIGLAGLDSALGAFTKMQKSLGVFSPGGIMSDYFRDHIKAVDLHKQAFGGTLANIDTFQNFAMKKELYSGVLGNPDAWKISAPNPAYTGIFGNIEDWNKHLGLGLSHATALTQEILGANSFAKIMSEHMSAIESQRQSLMKFVEQEKKERQTLKNQIDLILADRASFRVDDIVNTIDYIGGVDTEIVLPAQFIAYCNLHNFIGSSCQDLELEIRLLESAIKQKSTKTSQSVTITLTALRARFQCCVEKHRALINVPASAILRVTPAYAEYLHELWQLPAQLRELAGLLDQLWPDII